MEILKNFLDVCPLPQIQLIDNNDPRYARYAEFCGSKDPCHLYGCVVLTTDLDLDPWKQIRMGIDVFHAHLALTLVLSGIFLLFELRVIPFQLMLDLGFTRHFYIKLVFLQGTAFSVVMSLDIHQAFLIRHHLVGVVLWAWLFPLWYCFRNTDAQRNARFVVGRAVYRVLSTQSPRQTSESEDAADNMLELGGYEAVATHSSSQTSESEYAVDNLERAEAIPTQSSSQTSESEDVSDGAMTIGSPGGGVTTHISIENAAVRSVNAVSDLRVGA